MPLSFNKKPALVAYVTCGDPNLATTREIVLAAIDAGADVIELGVPFSDPVADGPVIQRASTCAKCAKTIWRQFSLPLQPVQTGGSMKSRGFRLGSCMPSLVPGLPASKSNSLRTRKPWFDA